MNQAKVKTSPEYYQDKRRYAVENIIKGNPNSPIKNYAKGTYGNTAKNTSKGTFGDIVHKATRPSQQADPHPHPPISPGSPSSSTSSWCMT